MKHKLKKFKTWHVKLINNFSKYEAQKLTWKEIAIEVDASWTAVETFVRRHKELFEKETLNQKWDALAEEMDNYNDRLDGFEAKVTSKPVEIVDTGHPHQGTHLVLGCVHVPFANEKILNGIYELMEDVKFDGISILGDFLDVNSLSSHDKGRFTAIPNLTLDMEYAAGNKVLDNFDNLLEENALKVFLAGNHCARVGKWNNDMQNAKTPLVLPDVALRLKERGYETKMNWMQDYFVLGEHLQLLHGIYYNQFCAKTHYDRLRKSCMFVHTHRIQTYVEGNGSAHNIGFLGDINSPAFGYAPRTMKSQWQNGFAITTIDEKGDYFIEQIIVCNDKFVYGGKIYG